MKKIIVFLMSLSLFFGLMNPVARDHIANTFFWLTMPEKEWKLWGADVRLRSDLSRGERARRDLVDGLYLFKGNVSRLKELNSFTESKAVSYRDTLQLAIMNNDATITIDGSEYSLTGMENQIVLLLATLQDQEKAIAEYEELIHVAEEKLQETIHSIARSKLALERIPLQKAILASNTASDSVDKLIAETKNIHMENKEFFADPLLTPSEIATRSRDIQTPSNSSAVSPEMLKTFLEKGSFSLTASNAETR